MPALPRFDAAISLLLQHRASLGDDVVDAAVAVLRRESQVAAPVAASPRLRQVSVLFCDVVDSTALLQKVSADEAADVLGTPVRRFGQAVEAAGGQVLRYTGDGLKAAFGAAGTREDDAQRAVEAGLAIVDAASRHAQWLQRRMGLPGFAVRVGIHTGPVLLGVGAEADQGAMGHAVHLAARMEQSAPIGRLRISHDTWVHVRDLFQFEPQPLLQVKGHDEPLRSYLVLGREAGDERGLQRGVEGMATPLVGREADLGRLMALVERATAERRVQALTLLADAGLGKSRLRAELLLRLRGIGGAPQVLQARAQPGQQLQPYALLRQLVARWLQIADDDHAEAARGALVAGLRPWLGDAHEAAAHRIGHLLGLDFGTSPHVRGIPARDLRDRGQRALLAALRALARQAPLLLVLDDLHWADDASLDFLQPLAEPAEVPIALLMLARPALLERRPHWLPATARHVLAPLDASGSATLVDALLHRLQGPSRALRELLVARAAGNPYWLEELVRMLLDDGTIERRTGPGGDTWHVHDDRIASLRVPDTLVGVLQARLDALPAAELAALQQASIVGPVFWDDALNALDPHAPAALPALRRKGLVQARTSSAFAHSGEHAFLHHLMHEVTYGTALQAMRRAGHAQAARWLSERLNDRAGEFLAVTAEHYERAGDSPRALEYWDRARLDAAQRYAHSAALAYADRALAQPALGAPRWRYQLAAARRQALDNLGRADEAAHALEAMDALACTADDDALRADVLTVRMLQADRAGHVRQAGELALQARDLAERSGAAVAAALAHGELAWLAVQRKALDAASGHLAQALPWARRAAQIPLREGGKPGYELQLRIIGVEVLLAQERPAQALEAIATAWPLLETATLHDRFSLQLRSGLALTLLGRLDEAMQALEQAGQTARDIEMPLLQATAATYAAAVACLQGDAARPRERAAEAVSLARGCNYQLALASALEHEGQALAGCGDAAAAQRCWDEAAALLQSQSRQAEALQVRARQAALAAQQGDLPGALAAVRAILAAAAAEPGAGADADTSPPADRGAGPATPATPAAPDAPTAPLLGPQAQWLCWQVLDAAGQPDADALLRAMHARLQSLLAQVPEAADRARLVHHLPHWRQVDARWRQHVPAPAVPARTAA